MFDLKSPLNESGQFVADAKIQTPELASTSFTDNLIAKRSQIADILLRFYQVPKLSRKRVSERINGNDKQLLSDTIDRLSLLYPLVGRLKGYLMDTAALESSFKLTSSVSPKIGTASGWFGFIDSTKKTILGLLGIKATREQFNNSPEIQVLAAAQLYTNVINLARREGVLQAAHSKGFSDEDVAHAYWLNPGWAKQYFLYGKVAGLDAFGTTVPSYLKKVHGTRS